MLKLQRFHPKSRYVAPEYTSGGKIKQTVDVFAFGLVLLELMTGQRISILQFYRGRNFLSDCFHPVTALEPSHVMESIYELLDPCLASEQLPEFACQLQAMGLAASLCLRQDPETRPPMSKVRYLTIISYLFTNYDIYGTFRF
jgi:interleukin-1 receptor-associated kinase 1